MAKIKIIKYANRKLYIPAQFGVTSPGYTSLGELSAVALDGISYKVIDDVSGLDITSLIEVQIEQLKIKQELGL